MAAASPSRWVQAAPGHRAAESGPPCCSSVQPSKCLGRFWQTRSFQTPSSGSSDKSTGPWWSWQRRVPTSAAQHRWETKKTKDGLNYHVNKVYNLFFHILIWFTAERKQTSTDLIPPSIGGLSRCLFKLPKDPRLWEEDDSGVQKKSLTDFRAVIVSGCCMEIAFCSMRPHTIARDAIATAPATWFPTETIWWKTKNNQRQNN